MAIDEALDLIEAELQEEGQRVVQAVRGAVRALQERDVELADEVIAFDDEIDEHFLSVERSIQSLLALQTPVAGDLRLLLAMLHINLLLERTADGCVTVAKLTQLVADAEPDSALVGVSREGGDLSGARRPVPSAEWLGHLARGFFGHGLEARATAVGGVGPGNDW